MSKIGNYALEIQGQANALGYSTIQEALDNGYEVIEDTLTKIDSPDALSELEQAHKAWLEEREQIISELRGLSNYAHEVGLGDGAQRVIARTIDFMMKGEV